MCMFSKVRTLYAVTHCSWPSCVTYWKKICMLFVSLGIKSILWIFLLCHCYLLYQNWLCGIIKYLHLCVSPHKIAENQRKRSFGFLNYAYLQIRDEIVKKSCTCIDKDNFNKYVTCYPLLNIPLLT